jgi:hypothetical protein
MFGVSNRGKGPRLDEWGIASNAACYLDCHDWIAAKWNAAILGRDRTDRP